MHGTHQKPDAKNNGAHRNVHDKQNPGGGRNTLAAAKAEKNRIQMPEKGGQGHAGERELSYLIWRDKTHRTEADTIARAGRTGAVTIATNMAGRGTDIELGEGVAANGGLHVILTEYHESPRIDRQLFGRAARQGDPGSGEAIVALDDELFAVHAPWLSHRIGAMTRTSGTVPAPALSLLRRVAQSAGEGRSHTARMASLKQDRRLASMLAFSGSGE